jgi:hypothetical protein
MQESGGRVKGIGGGGRDDPGRDDPARSSVIFSEWGSDEEEEDLASGGRSDLGRRAAPQPYRQNIMALGFADLGNYGGNP